MAGGRSGYLKYNGGGPVFLSGPDNLEEFLYRGTLNPDGTRSGDKMEQTDFYNMRPSDELSAGSTRWALANPGESYIACTYDCWGPMGVKGMAAGTYDLLWFDAASGKTVKQAGVAVPAGEATWPRPAGLGKEIALYIKRR